MVKGVAARNTNSNAGIRPGIVVDMSCVLLDEKLLSIAAPGKKAPGRVNEKSLGKVQASQLHPNIKEIVFLCSFPAKPS